VFSCAAGAVPDAATVPMRLSRPRGRPVRVTSAVRPGRESGFVIRARRPLMPWWFTAVGASTSRCRFSVSPSCRCPAPSVGGRDVGAGSFRSTSSVRPGCGCTARSLFDCGNASFSAAAFTPSIQLSDRAMGTTANTAFVGGAHWRPALAAAALVTPQRVSPLIPLFRAWQLAGALVRQLACSTGCEHSERLAEAGTPAIISDYARLREEHRGCPQRHRDY